MKKLSVNQKVMEAFRWGNRALGFTLDIYSTAFSILSLFILTQGEDSGMVGLGIIALTNFQGVC